jgi:hypothetical protein
MGSIVIADFKVMLPLQTVCAGCTQALTLNVIRNDLMYLQIFASGKECLLKNVAFKLTDSIFKSMNQKMYVGGIFCDLAKASDSVNREILTKLRFYGIKGATANWFKSYLTNGKQKFEIKASNSTQSIFSSMEFLRGRF